MSDTPYKDLRPYSEEDAPRFFGREKERKTIAANLRASRLTVFYGASGVGKSSVLHAGVVPDIKKLSLQNPAEPGRPGLIVVYCNSWGENPVDHLLSCVEECTEQYLKSAQQLPAPSPKRKSAPGKDRLLRVLQAQSKGANATLLIILDQFEEYLVYHPRVGGDDTFDAQFPPVLNEPNLWANFLISIREESLAKLDRFEERIPDLLGNRLRMDYLGCDSARAAIEEPVKWYNDQPHSDGKKAEIEQGLVDAVLEQVKIGKLETRIETSLLQLVMTRLWEREEEIAKSHMLRLGTLTGLGGAKQIVREYLDKTMGTLSVSGQDSAAKIFHYLVTPHGAKIAQSPRDLAVYAKLSETDLQPLLVTLANARILRPLASLGNQESESYQIFHDVLAPAVLDWVTTYHSAKATRDTLQEVRREGSWSGVNLDLWRRGWAYEAAKRRAALYFGNMTPDEMLREMTRTKGPSNREEELSDWQNAGIQLAYELFDSRIGLTQILPEDYPRLEQYWLEDIKRVKAYHIWVEGGARWSPECTVDNYMRACDIIQEKLKATSKPGTPAQFYAIVNYVEKRYLADGVVDDKKPEAHSLIETKARRLWVTTGETDCDRNWFAAAAYVCDYYENIAAAVTGATPEAWERVFALLQATDKKRDLINVFEMAIAVCFLPASAAGF